LRDRFARQRPRSGELALHLARTSSSLAVLGFLVGLAAPAALAQEGGDTGLDLEGTWHVLIHYTDADAADPEVMRWDDRLWVFERKGSRLSWTEYPIVVFNDRTGRFERSSSGQRRVLHAWEPNAGQRAQIDAGLEFNTLGSKTKSLRRKRDGSWQSTGSPQTLGASTIAYRETWSISGGEVPTFTRDDVLGSQRAESMSGRTQYTGTEIAADGNVIRGDFARDESRRGPFRMVRAGAAASVGTKRSLRERMTDGLNLETFEDEVEK
jgi:hypothetical protein